MASAIRPGAVPETPAPGAGRRARPAHAVSLRRAPRSRYPRCSNWGPRSTRCRSPAPTPRSAPKRICWKRRLARMERKRASADSKARQLELAWEGRIGWGKVPAQIRLQLRDELARLLMRLAVGGDVAVEDDNGKC